MEIEMFGECCNFFNRQKQWEERVALYRSQFCWEQMYRVHLCFGTFQFGGLFRSVGGSFMKSWIGKGNFTEWPKLYMEITGTFSSYVAQFVATVIFSCHRVQFRSLRKYTAQMNWEHSTNVIKWQVTYICQGRYCFPWFLYRNVLGTTNK